MISNINVYGIEESAIASKYPMSIEPGSITADSGFERLMKLAKAKPGSGHDCALKGIVAQFDVTLPQHVWMQALRYHWFDIVSSQSKMHRLLQMDLEKQISPRVDQRVVAVLREKICEYKDGKISYDEVMENVPCGLLLTARVTTNYLQLKTIYFQRKEHKLDWWTAMCKQFESLPYFKELIQEV